MNKKLIPHHVGISVANMEESIQWYQTHLKGRLEYVKDFPPLKAKIAFIKIGDFKIELFEHYETKALNDYRKHPLTDMQYQGTLHICFEVKEGIEVFFEKLKTNEVDIVMGPMLSPPKDAMMGFIRDNTGNLIEVIQMMKN